MHDFLGKRRPFLTAKRLLSNQTFRDIYRTDTLDVDQRLKITSLTFLFTDLKGSTELYDRVGDLVAFDIVREHFRVLHESVAAEGGAVVKTIGDAVMATFPTPDRALAAALGMREAMRSLNAAHGRDDLLLKIGIHEGPCLAVSRTNGRTISARRSILPPEYRGSLHRSRSWPPRRSSTIHRAPACWPAARSRRRGATCCAASAPKSRSTRSLETSRASLDATLPLTQIGQVFRQTRRPYPPSTIGRNV